jgi:glycerol-1-phosphate dehydrogenase [NAD(P)+]
MNEILGKSIRALPGLEFDCSCGKKHKVSIKNIRLGSGIEEEVVSLAAYYGQKRIFLMADCNTYDVLGKRVEKRLKQEGFLFDTFVFDTKDALIPDEKAVGRLLVEIGEDTKLIIAVGSGTMNDLARMLSCKLHIPYFIVCTAPSMDGYASTVSPLIIEGFKKTYPGVYAESIIADTAVMKNAPMPMLYAGFGDIIGKLCCLEDWVLARELNGEQYCETTAKIVRSAVAKCVDNLAGIKKREETAIGSITEALILSGIAIGLVGTSRPASGAEHHLAHYWEMDAIAAGRSHPLHGNAVGVGAVISASIYELMADRVPSACKPPKPQYIAGLLRELGACDSPKALGIDRALFHKSILHAKEVRPRYTIFSLAASYNLLERFADELTERFYG